VKFATACGLLGLGLMLFSRDAPSDASTSASTTASTVGTVAGSGNLGNLDGPAASASFLAPAGIAVAPDGTIAVSDDAGQRIRTIRNGSVETLAGGGALDATGDWVPGGYRDGTGSEARFNRPSGLAYLPDGALLVADTLNHCIRSIRGAVVTTFAGNARVAGAADGPKTAATFESPRGLAVDTAGNVYIADDGSGLREIVHGVVSTIPLPGIAENRALSVAVAADGSAARVFVSTFAGLVVIDASTGANEVYATIAEGRRPFGYPGAVLAIRKDAVVFTDTRDQTVRLFRMPRRESELPLVQPLPRDVIEDGANNGGGYRDGPLQGARFAAPDGIGRTAQGDLIVADTGNRRIRSIHTDALRLPLAPDAQDLPRGRTWIVGGSALYYDTLWPDSIPGAVAAIPGNENVEALQYDETNSAEIESSLAKVLKAQPQRVVWVLTTHESATLGETSLAALLGRLAASPALSVCIVPMAGDLLSPRSFAMLDIDPAADLAGARARYDALREIVRSSKVHALDLTEPFQNYEAAANGGTLYATLTPYLTDLGRTMTGRAIADDLSQIGR
jgi:sugar lactone lactonase YvrE